LSELVYPADSNRLPTISSLQVRDDRHALSPAHALYADLAAIGAGRYSHWNGYLIFSTSDNSDPRSNGRVFSIFIRTNLHIVSLFAVCLAGITLYPVLYPDQARKQSFAWWNLLKCFSWHAPRMPEDG
jgi:hypothetical protein